MDFFLQFFRKLQEKNDTEIKKTGGRYLIPTRFGGHLDFNAILGEITEAIFKRIFKAYPKICTPTAFLYWFRLIEVPTAWESSLQN